MAVQRDADDLGHSLRAVMRATHDANLALARNLGLGLNDVVALDHLISAGPLGPAELAARIGVTPASATGLIDRLEAAGHVRRTPHASDRRKTIVVATERAGLSIFAAIGPLIGTVEAAAADLDGAARGAIVTYLDRVARALADYRPPPGPES